MSMGVRGCVCVVSRRFTAVEGAPMIDLRACTFSLGCGIRKAHCCSSIPRIIHICRFHAALRRAACVCDADSCCVSGHWHGAHGSQGEPAW